MLKCSVNFKSKFNRAAAIFLVILTLSACTSKTNGVPKTSEETKSISPSAGPGSALSASASPVALNKDVFDTKKFDGQLRVYFFDFNEPGKVYKEDDPDKAEDSMLIITPDNKTMLIDAAKEEVAKKLVGYLDKLDVNKIDIAVATHRHSDHVGGYPLVIVKKEIGRFMTAKYAPAYYAFTGLEKQGVKVEYPDDGSKFKLGEFVEFEVFADDKDLDKPTTEGDDPVNNKSMVLKMTYKNNSFLFAADIHKQREMELVTNNQKRSIDADVIKVPHHGWDTSSNSNFIKAVSPKIAVIETYALVRPQVVARYVIEHADVHMTSDNGNILVTSDGDTLTVIEEKKVEKRKLY